MCADEEIAKCLIQFHVMTGSDAKSCFYGHGKTTLYDKMAKSSEARKKLSKCRESLPLQDDILNELISYVIRFVYSDSRSSSLNSARAVKWKGQKKKSLMRIPPDFDSLKQHIMCANYLAYIQCHHELKVHPSPIGHGWELVNGSCKPVRHTQPCLPPTFEIPPLPELSDCSDSEYETEKSDSDSDADISSDEYG
jgi:hypothetical protein